MGQSHLAKGIYTQNEGNGNRPSSRVGSGRASNAVTKAMSNHKKVTSPNKVAIACVALLAVLAICGVDGLINGNKIYEGVVIGDVAVGGLTKARRQYNDCVSGEYSQRVSSNVATFFTTQENVDNPKATDTDANIEEQISYEQSLARFVLDGLIPSNEVEATLDIDSLVETSFRGRQERWQYYRSYWCGYFRQTYPINLLLQR